MLSTSIGNVGMLIVNKARRSEAEAWNLEAEAKAWTLEAEAWTFEAEATISGLKAEARPRGLTSWWIAWYMNNTNNDDDDRCNGLFRTLRHVWSATPNTSHPFKKTQFFIKPYVPREPQRDPSNRRLYEHGIYWYICWSLLWLQLF